MDFSKQLAKHLRDVHFGGNWTYVNLKESLADVSWEESVTQVYALNTIATLVYHIHYFIDAVTKVLEGEALNAHDKFSFSHPPVESEADWTKFLDKVFAAAEHFAALMEQVPDTTLENDFSEKKYGSYYRNFQGIIEHTHYHLGQIVIIKKVIRGMKNI